MRGLPTLLHLLVCILCIALKYNNPKSLKITKVSYLLHFFTKTRALGFRYFELQNIFNELKSHKKFQYSVVGSFIDSGAGLVLSMYMVRFSPSIEQQKHL